MATFGEGPKVFGIFDRDEGLTWVRQVSSSASQQVKSHPRTTQEMT
jgi:hypothetical protein